MKLSQESDPRWPGATAGEALDAYREALASPRDRASGGVAEANLRAVLARAAAGDPGPLDDDELADDLADELLPRSSTAAPRWSIAVGVALAIAAAIFLIFGGPPGVAGQSARREDPSAASDQGEGPGGERARLRGRGGGGGGERHVSAEPAEVEPERPEERVAVVPEVAASPASERGVTTPAPTPARSKLPSPSAAPREASIPDEDAAIREDAGPRADDVEGSATDTLRREAALIRQIRRALDQGDHAGALARVEEHRREFPRGTLTEERDAFAAIALCRLHRPLEGRGQARVLLAAHPRTIHADAVREACYLDR